IIGPSSPPYTGMSVATETILKSSLQDQFNIIHLDTVDKRAIGNMGRFDFINIILAFSHFFRFIKLCVKEKPVLIYLPIAQNLPGYLRDSLFLTVSRILEIKTVVHLHGGYFRDFYEKSSLGGKGLIRFTLKNVSGVIVLGHCLKYIFDGLIDEKKIFVVPNGIRDNFNGYQRIYHHSGPTRLLFLSNFLKDKGIFEVLRVIPDILSYTKNVRFIFAGEWYKEKEKEEALEFIKQKGIESYVEFKGVVEGVSKEKCLINSDIFLLPTFYPFEGQPLTILEAMSSGLPVITTNKGAISETVLDGENGFHVKAKNSLELIEKIMELVSCPDLREKIGRRNRETYLNKYTQDIFVGNLYRVLKKAVSKTVGIRKKVLFIVPLPPPYAGPEVISEMLLQSCLKENYELIHLRSNLNAKNKDKGRVHFLSAARFIMLCFKIIKVCIFQKPSVIYLLLSQNFTGFVRDSLVLFICKAFQKKIVFHFHGSNFENFYNCQSEIFKAYIRFLLRRIDILILQARWLKKFFLRFVSDEKLKVIYNPVNAIQFSPGRVSAQTGNKINVFYMSYLSIAKGFLVFVKVIREIIKENRDIHFFIAGGIIDRERNIFFSQNGERIEFNDVNKIIHDIKYDKLINQQITFLNEIKNMKRKRDIFSRSDIFVLPSYSEGCPMVVLEAMASGLPVVVTPVGALPEIIEEGKNGFFVKIGDPISLKEKIILLANNIPLCREIGENNRRLIESKFTVETIIPQFQDVF
ncbi:MAG: glycosyltransferase family 4 protein, partial [Candidatus Omnitrophica bacterium]|nr:glycosyltransferase family 4 protein [Candidatus Omnitrophota bacterium]